jgi:UDP:flavonoid glycosyltransferase YjiC (YdhE family)
MARRAGLATARSCEGRAIVTRFLFVVPPFAGHVNATVAVGDALARRGHEVAWTGHQRTIAPLLPAGARLLPLAVPGRDDFVERTQDRRDGMRGAAALRFLWEEVLVPLAIAMAPGVEAAVAAFEPDVLVVDQQAIAGAVVAQRRGLPWATSATTPAELAQPYALIPKVGDWICERLYDLQLLLGVPDQQARVHDPRFSDHLVLVFSTEALLGPLDRFPAHYAFVGPAIGARPLSAHFPWDWLDPARRHVLVTLGTVSRDAGGRFLDVVVQAVSMAPLADRVQVIVVAPAGMVEQPPPHVLVCAQVPQLDLLTRFDAVVCHAGHNTVCESLAHGVPLVVAPIRDDQPIIAQQVVEAGAGVRVPFARVGPAQLAGAVAAVLDDSSYRGAAARVQASFSAAGGAAEAADRLERLR